jgi:hypothetical protein
MKIMDMMNVDLENERFLESENKMCCDILILRFLVKNSNNVLDFIKNRIVFIY